MSKKHAPSPIPIPASPYGTQAIQEAILEPWPNPAPEEIYETNISYPEFTCLCPRSGYPDFATILIRYRPAQKIVELKSLKLYLNSFRDRAISHEAVTALIYRDLMNLLEPSFLEVKGDFNVRGNVKTVISIDSEMRKATGKSSKKR
jgi:7-cyano-7-deazaguanine reductase